MYIFLLNSGNSKYFKCVSHCQNLFNFSLKEGFYKRLVFMDICCLHPKNKNSNITKRHKVMVQLRKRKKEFPGAVSVAPWEEDAGVLKRCLSYYSASVRVALNSSTSDIEHQQMTYLKKSSSC